MARGMWTLLCEEEDTDLIARVDALRASWRPGPYREVVPSALFEPARRCNHCGFDPGHPDPRWSVGRSEENADWAGAVLRAGVVPGGRVGRVPPPVARADRAHAEDRGEYCRRTGARP